MHEGGGANQREGREPQPKGPQVGRAQEQQPGMCGARESLLGCSRGEVKLKEAGPHRLLKHSGRAEEGCGGERLMP